MKAIKDIIITSNVYIKGLYIFNINNAFYNFEERHLDSKLCSGN